MNKTSYEKALRFKELLMIEDGDLYGDNQITPTKARVIIETMKEEGFTEEEVMKVCDINTAVMDNDLVPISRLHRFARHDNDWYQIMMPSTKEVMEDLEKA